MSLSKLISLIFLFIFVIHSVDGQPNKVTGYYSSNFAIIGWFSVQILLSSDSTFKYQYIGDLTNDKAKGIYKVVKDTVYLEFEDTYVESWPDLLDTVTYISTDTTGKEITLTVDFNQPTSPRPQKLLFKGRKLLIMNSDGQVEKRIEDRKGRLRNFYLKKNENHTWTDWGI